MPALPSDVPSDADATAAPNTPPSRRPHGGGNWRSLVISMGVVLVVILAWLALLPRPVQREHVPVDVTASAQQVVRETSWPVRVPRLGEEWVPTSVRFAPSAQGPRTWHIGYNRADDDQVYVAVEQTRASATPSTDQAWIDALTHNGQPVGEETVAGQRWEQYASGGDNPRRSLVRRDDGGLMTVVTGIAGADELATVAGSLAPFSAGATPATSPG